jgi:hypothetical protein
MSKITVNVDHFGSWGRVTLPAPLWEGRRQLSAGITLEAIYRGPRSGRMFIRTYSQWDNGNGACKGPLYTEIDQAEYIYYCEKVGCEPVGITPVEA